MQQAGPAEVGALFLAHADELQERIAGIGASALRIGVRLAVALAWLVLALVCPWAWLSLLLWVCAGLAVAHAALGVANRVKNGGVTLRLMGSGAIEWPQSYQEQWLRRPVDFVDGARIEVIVEAPIPAPAPAAPHVILKGATRNVAHLPLYGRTPAEFMETVNALVAGRGIALVEEGDGRKPREA
jgi:hypothetical protein